MDPDAIRPKSIVAIGLSFLSTHPWKSWLLVIFILASFVVDVTWVWGVFWFWWAWTCVQLGEVVFLESIRRVQYPVLFWTMIACWILVGCFYLASGLYPQLLEYRT